MFLEIAVIAVESFCEDLSREEVVDFVACFEVSEIAVFPELHLLEEDFDDAHHCLLLRSWHLYLHEAV